MIPFATDESINSYLGLTNIGPAGGIANRPAVCGDRSQRTAVVKSQKTDQETGEVISNYPTLNTYIFFQS